MHRRILSRPQRLAAFAAIALTLAACGQGDDEPTATPPSEESDDADGAATTDGEPNEADVTFVRGMIPHHVGAIDMAELVPDRTDRPELISLSEEIVAAQDAEIDQMRSILERAGDADMPMDDIDDMHDMEGMDMEGMGMMSEEDMAALEASEGAEFERLFLEDMIVHHQGAIDMAETVLAEGSDPEVEELAGEIIAAQESEIEQMDSWLDEWELA